MISYFNSFTIFGQGGLFFSIIFLETVSALIVILKLGLRGTTDRHATIRFFKQFLMFEIGNIPLNRFI